MANRDPTVSSPSCGAVKPQIPIADCGAEGSAADPVLSAIQRSWSRLSRISSLARLHGQILARIGLSIEQSAYPILTYLSSFGPSRMTDLADAIGIDLSTLSRQVAVLERRQLVIRTADPFDRRARILRPTESGKEILTKIADAHQKVLAETLSDWSLDDLVHLRILLERLVSDSELRLDIFAPRHGQSRKCGTT